MEIILLTKSTTPIIGWVADILGYLMDLIFKMTANFGVVNIGWSIIIFTVIINLIMLPLTVKQQKSSKLMAVMQPEIQAIQNKYKGKKDQDSMMKQQAEMKLVYEKYGTSMTGGCVQLLIQMPILFALYQVIMRIPAYVSSVRQVFENIANPLMQQTDWINKTADIAAALAMPADKNDYTQINKVIDLLYKFTPDNWAELGRLFPDMSAVLAENVKQIENMNMFFGMNLATVPWQGFTSISLTWLIPILSGLTQWYSTHLMMKNQPSNANADESPMAQQMKSMNTVMPLMSVWFCFTMPAGLGLYWVASAVARILQQLAINKYLEGIDVDKMVQENIRKSNERRAKKGLAPQTIDKAAIARIKKEEEKKAKEEELREQKKEVRNKQVEDSTAYYHKNAKAGSLASKANMVAMYNEKNEKKK